MSYLPIHDQLLKNLISWRSYAGHHSCCEFKVRWPLPVTSERQPSTRYLFSRSSQCVLLPLLQCSQFPWRWKRVILSLLSIQQSLILRTWSSWESRLWLAPTGKRSPSNQSWPQHSSMGININAYMAVWQEHTFLEWKRHWRSYLIQARPLHPILC